MNKGSLTNAPSISVLQLRLYSRPPASCLSSEGFYLSILGVVAMRFCRGRVGTKRT